MYFIYFLPPPTHFVDTNTEFDSLIKIKPRMGTSHDISYALYNLEYENVIRQLKKAAIITEQLRWLPHTFFSIVTELYRRQYIKNRYIQVCLSVYVDVYFALAFVF